MALNKLSGNKDIQITADELSTLNNEERNTRFKEVWMEIEKMMRDEIGYYGK